MNPLKLRIINYKINNLTVEELLNYAKQYQLKLTRAKAVKIIRILKKERIDISDEKQRDRLIRRIEKEFSPQTKKNFFRLLIQYNVPREYFEKYM